MIGLSLDSAQSRTTGVNSGWVSIYQTLLYSIAFIIAIVGMRMNRDGILTTAWVFGLWCFMCGFVRLETLAFRQIIVMTFNTFAIPIGLSFGKFFMRQTLYTHWNIVFFLLQIPTLLVGSMLFGVGEKFDSDCAFAFFLYMPLIFFFRNDYMKLSFLALYGILILLAGKRSVFIAYIICVIIYLSFVLLSNRNKRKVGVSLKRFAFISIVFVVIFVILSNFSSQFEYIMNRFQNIEDDGGSGRDVIYAALFGDVSSSDFLSLFWGHGYYAVLNRFQIGAHNDFLEIFYDYGIVALLLYLLLLGKLFVKWYHSRGNLKNNSILPSVLLINFVMILVLGMLNCIILSTFFSFLLYFATGITIESLKYSHACPLKVVDGYKS